MAKLDDDSRVELSEALIAHLATKTDSELLTASGLGLPQPEQYKTQRTTADTWKPFAQREVNKQFCSYANVPLLIIAEIARRKGCIPTIRSVIRDVIDAGFAPRKQEGWARNMESELIGYIQSAEQRGLCRLRSVWR